MHYFQEHIKRQKTGQTGESGKKDPNLCVQHVDGTAAARQGLVPLSIPPTPCKGGMACPRHLHVRGAGDTCFGQGNMNGGGEWPFQEGAPKGQSSILPSHVPCHSD